MMKRLSLMLLVFCGCFAQVQLPPPGTPGTTTQNSSTPGPGDPDRLPNGKSRQEELVKIDYKKNLADATELARLAEEVKADLEKDDKYIVSIKMLKKTEDIEKLAKNIRGRLKRY
jgi:hypothetical protein